MLGIYQTPLLWVGFLPCTSSTCHSIKITAYFSSFLFWMGKTFGAKPGMFGTNELAYVEAEPVLWSHSALISSWSFRTLRSSWPSAFLWCCCVLSLSVTYYLMTSLKNQAQVPCLVYSPCPYLYFFGSASKNYSLI